MPENVEKIDLGEDLGELPSTVSNSKKSPKYYPSLSFGDKGVKGESRFDTKDIDKTVRAEVDIRLMSVESSLHTKGQTFSYRFEVRNLYLKEKT